MRLDVIHAVHLKQVVEIFDGNLLVARTYPTDVDVLTGTFGQNRRATEIVKRVNAYDDLLAFVRRVADGLPTSTGQIEREARELVRRSK